MTEEQTITFVEILNHLPAPDALYEESHHAWSMSNLCLQYDDFDVSIEQQGNAYLTPATSIKPVLIYDAHRRVFDVSGVPVSPLHNILQKVCGDV